VFRDQGCAGVSEGNRAVQILQQGPKTSHHGCKQLGIGEGDGRRHRCKRGQRRGWGRGQLEVPL